MRFLFLSFCLSVFLNSCQKDSKRVTSITQLIPENASIILKIHDFETFKSDLSNSDFFNQISQSKPYQDLDQTLNVFKNYKFQHPIILAFNPYKDALQYTFITKQSEETDSLDLKEISTTVIDSFFVASNTALKSPDTSAASNNQIASLLNIADPEKSFSLVLKKKYTNTLGLSLYTPNSTNFGNWTLLDANISPSQLSFNGLISNEDNPDALSRIFHGNIPQENTIQNITPIQSDGFTSLTFNDYQTLKQRLDLYNTKVIDSSHTSELFETINEIGEIYLSNSSVIALKSIDVAATKEALRQHQNVKDNFRGTEILHFEDSLFIQNTFKPILTKKVSTYIILKDFFVFAEDTEPLKTIISNHQNGTVLSQNEAFITNFSYLSDESSLLVIAAPNKLNTQLQALLDSEKQYDISAYKFSAFQLIEDDGYAHLNTIIKKSKKRALANTISEELNINLDADVLNPPQFVKNHRTQQKEIVVQDINNQFYLISNTGKILWKKRLNGPILGDIKQVDLYKNNRLQFIFATPNHLYIVDRNGNDVAPFPMKFKKTITQPLSVFDYDNNKDYRFLVTQNNSLLMLDGKGKTVSGFSYKNEHPVTKQPKHFRVRDKDYIVFASNNTLKVLNRRGEDRIHIKDSINFSKNPIFLYKNTFATTTMNGELAQANLKGALSKQTLGLGANHKIDATSKTLVSLSDNKLNIKHNTYELEYGDYTLPKIFYLNDKIYVSLTDRQSQKIYLFDSNAKLQTNFPVFGNSTIDLDNIDSDRNLEFVTVGDSNSIIVYKKN